jgi:hypothetical protein
MLHGFDFLQTGGRTILLPRRLAPPPALFVAVSERGRVAVRAGIGEGKPEEGKNVSV